MNFKVTKNLKTLKSRTMSKVNQLTFQGETIYVGLDVHKSNWKVNARLQNMELSSFSQDPHPVALSKHFQKHYPGARVKVVYEAGFCGFGIQRSLNDLGIDCLVVNAADVPTSDKERKRKADKRDARKLSRELADGSVTGIYIPQVDMEHARTLVRERFRLVQDQIRCQNRIKHMLMFSGITLDIKQERWSKKHLAALEKVECKTMALRTALNFAIEEYKQIRNILKQATLFIRKMAQQPPFQKVQEYLQSIDGIGVISGMIIQTELQDIKRFKTLDHLCDYAGFVPDINSSDERMVIKGITSRCNEFLRQTITESSWTLIKKDPAMLMKYQEYIRRMNKNKAIVRIGKHLLSRIRYVWNNETKYERGIVK